MIDEKEKNVCPECGGTKLDFSNAKCHQGYWEGVEKCSCSDESDGEWCHDDIQLAINSMNAMMDLPDKLINDIRDLIIEDVLEKDLTIKE